MSQHSYSSSSRSYYSSHGTGAPGYSKVTETYTSTGPDGKPHTETKTYTSGVQSGGMDFGKGLQKIGGWVDDGANMLKGIDNTMKDLGFGGRNANNSSNTIVGVKNQLTEARYKRGWGNAGGSARRYRPPQQLEGKNYADIKNECLSKGILFEDPDFPAVDKSIFYSRTPPRPFEWMRPPEITSNAQLFVGGASRFDVKQGELGDCWLLAAVACLCGDKKLLYRVVPPDQSFQQDYAGIFHFQFWRYGEWEDVVVDDRLPTFCGKLVFMHSDQNNEFWTALLEKAYAKLCGSYEALKGGSTSEAMEDFTGGVTEMFDFRQNLPANLFQIMLKAFQRSSLMGCSIEAMPGKMEAELDNGLIMGHAYSITDVKLIDIQTSRMKGKIPMVRIRNPWGNECEWKGAWSDKSPEWKFISDEERKEIGLSFSDDGEFWMAYSDFVKNFQKLEICHLGPDELDPTCKRWEATQQEGAWVKRVNAGGCRNYLETFWTNPQYTVEVVDADDDDDENGTLIVALMQKDRRKLKAAGVDLLTMGYAIYKLKEGTPEGEPLDMRFFKYNASCAKSPSFINLREVCGRHLLPPGKYAILPSTFEPNQEGAFVLRIFSEKENKTAERDEETDISDVQVVEVEDQKDGKRKYRFFPPFHLPKFGIDFELPSWFQKEKNIFSGFSSLLSSEPLEVQEHGVMSETSMELTSGNEPLQPVEEVIVATKAQTQTGERNLEVADSQPQTDENPPSLAAPAPFLNSSYSNSESYDTEEEIQEEVIVPSRAVPQTGERAFFSERIFSESGDDNDVEGSIVAEAASVVESRRPRRGPAVDVTQIDKKQEDAMRAAFRKVSGTDMEIDAYELQDILNAAFMKGSEFKFEGFTPDTCRSLVAMMDLDQSGKLGFEEFKKLWTDLRIWKAAFKDHDKDKSGNFNSYELRSAFHSIGLRVSNMTFNSLVLRYSRRDGKIYFDDYIHCVARLKTMFDVYKAAQKGRKAEFGLDEFIQTTMYS